MEGGFAKDGGTAAGELTRPDLNVSTKRQIAATDPEGHLFVDDRLPEAIPLS